VADQIMMAKTEYKCCKLHGWTWQKACKGHSHYIFIFCYRITLYVLLFSYVIL